ncbi:Pectin degradation repressor protein KdgR [Capillimicrobium parvum]|uniref:Pectin degradation repressor protein KdgR n=2 Tax=Capillimicrobium parvum TaxID=2884022 RepID=A0A9E7C369_9ACTN|nr:Pectin degradation repressor protein KdgR [Capillimicrobium parvum]
MKSSHGDAVLDRAFQLLRAFSAERPQLTLAEMVARSGLPRSTAHRLACQLERHGALERGDEGWRLGVGLFELGQLVTRRQRLRDLALAHMEDLYEATRATVHLAVLEGDDVLYVEMLSGHRKVPTPSRVGGRMPAHCTGVGKALLAYSDEACSRLARATEPLAAVTARSITDPGRLYAELLDVRRRGIAVDREEAAANLMCLAAPLLVAAGVAEAGLSVSMPARGRLQPRDVEPALRAAAQRLGRTLRQART